MVLSKQLKLVNWGTLVEVYDDSGVLLNAEDVSRIVKAQGYNALKESFVKSLRVDCPDGGSPVLRIKVKQRSDSIY